jgi:hypothetical protein
MCFGTQSPPFDGVYPERSEWAHGPDPALREKGSTQKRAVARRPLTPSTLVTCHPSLAVSFLYQRKLAVLVRLRVFPFHGIKADPENLVMFVHNLSFGSYEDLVAVRQKGLLFL